MTKHIGILACSAEGAALCYQTIASEAPALMGEHMHPEISMHTHPLGEYMLPIYEDDWNKVAELMLSSLKKLASIGADFAVCPDNTIHQSFPFFIEEAPIPILHIAECVAQEARLKGYKKLGITGTKYLMTGPVYPEQLSAYELAYQIPNESDRDKINTIIFKELVNGDFPESSRLYFNAVIQRFKDEGCDSVVLGCTEIPLLVDPADCPLPTLDSTRLLARAAIREALRA